MNGLPFSDWPLYADALILFGAAGMIAAAGVKMAALADKLADRTGMGEAVTGALLLGASTSLPGIVTSTTTALAGSPHLSISNAVGGITVQTAFLAIADLNLRRVNLEHAAASAASIVQANLLIILLCLPLVAMQLPALTIWHVNPVSPIMLGTYIIGMRIVAKAKTRPMWRPRKTPETVTDEPDERAQQQNLLKLFLKFAFYAAMLAISGYLVARSGSSISSRTGLSQTAVGAYLMAVSTSLPELVTSVAAVRQGALALAIGGIIGGNAFDTLFLAVADVAYRKGSLYHAADSQQKLLLLTAILMTAVLSMGMLGREKRGIANIGGESFIILLLYLVVSLYIFLSASP